MRILTWNVNGIRALVQYHPYCDDLHKNYKEILDYLNADVLCFQETKITRSKLGVDLALVPTYDSYWSFHRRKAGYSGVAVYIKDHYRLVAVEQGISGILSSQMAVPPPPPPPSTSRETANATPSGVPFELRRADQSASVSIPANNTVGATIATTTTTTSENPNGLRSIGGHVTHYEPSVLQELDGEGRALVLDFGLFVLFNLYCPNETDETRLPFKIAFYTVLEERVLALMAQGRQVIIVGDMNVVPSELDHCDPEKWKKDTGITNFTDTEPRRWFNRFLSTGGGPMVDLYRVFHPDEKGAFTCWNTLINARPSNYGTRLDFVLVTKDLVPWFKSCDRLPQIVGSDHCPVVCEFWDQIEVPEQGELGENMHVDGEGQHKERPPTKTIRLKDALESYNGTKDHPLAARMYDEFAGKQQKLLKFFKAPKTSAATTSTTPSSSTMVAATSFGQGPGEKRSAAATSPATLNEGEKRQKLALDEEIQPPSTSSLPLTQHQAISESHLSQSPAPSQASNDTSIPIGGFTQPSIPSSAPVVAVTTTTVKDSKPKRAPAPAKSSGGWPPKRSGTKSSTTAATATSKAKSGGQTMLSSFFKRPSDQAVVADAAPPKDPPETSLSFSQNEEDAPSLSQDSSTSSSQTESEFYRDLLSTSASANSYTVNSEETTSKWMNMFTKKDVPTCNIHNVPCTEYRVNKKGPNKGRLFYLCSKPVGPEGTLVGTNPDYRCDFFQWKNPPSAKQGQIPFSPKSSNGK